MFFRKMAPFRWPEISNDLMLAREVAAKNPKNGAEWETIACLLSRAFNKDGKTIDLTGRACKDRLERLITKHKDDDKKSLKK